MSSERWLSPWKDTTEKPAIYHCKSHVIVRRLIFGDIECEHFRRFMRMQKNFGIAGFLPDCI